MAPDWKERWNSAFAITAIGILAIAFLVGTWLFIYWYIGPSTPKERNDAVALIAQIFGGVALLGGLFFTWKAQRFTQKTTDENLSIARQSLEVSEQRHIHERFMRAIDQIGGKELWARVGGIYALEQIARDCDEYYSPIMQVLTAYVRENARSKEIPHPKDSDTPLEREVPIRPDPDIQAVLRVIGRRDKYLGRGEDQTLNFSDNYQYVEFAVDLRGAELNDAHLEGADMRGVRLEGASLIRAHLRGAALWEACFDQAFLVDADLEGANLERASLKNARMVGANLYNTNLSGANLVDAVVSYEQLANAATLSGATLPKGEVLSFEEEEKFKQSGGKMWTDGVPDT